MKSEKFLFHPHGSLCAGDAKCYFAHLLYFLIEIKFHWIINWDFDIFFAYFEAHMFDIPLYFSGNWYFCYGTLKYHHGNLYIAVGNIKYFNWNSTLENEWNTKWNWNSLHYDEEIKKTFIETVAMTTWRKIKYFTIFRFINIWSSGLRRCCS